MGTRTFLAAVFSAHILQSGLSTLVHMSNNKIRTPKAEMKIHYRMIDTITQIVYNNIHVTDVQSIYNNIPIEEGKVTLCIQFSPGITTKFSSPVFPFETKNLYSIFFLYSINICLSAVWITVNEKSSLKIGMKV